MAAATDANAIGADDLSAPLNDTATLNATGPAGPVFEQPDPEEIQHTIIAFYLVLVSPSTLPMGATTTTPTRLAVLSAHRQPADMLQVPCLAVCDVWGPGRAGELAEAPQAHLRPGDARGALAHPAYHLCPTG